jgi:hypothetical protein
MKSALQPDEHEVVGRWVVDGGSVRGDAHCDRIHYLVEHVLTPLGGSPDGWDHLFLDPADGRFWERSYPHSDWHGGGPPALTVISAEIAKTKYGLP